MNIFAWDSSFFSNLWSFVAKFTELGAQKLFKLYRTASRKRDDKKKEIQKMKASYSSTLYEVGKKSTPAKQKLEEARKRTLGELFWHPS